MNLLDIAIAKKMSGGGGSEPTIESLSISENGTYSVPAGVDGYNPITVNVSGITPTGTISITQNGTVDVTQYASANVNVSGGGGSSYTLLAEQDFEVSTTSTSTDTVGSITLQDFFTSANLLYIRIRDKAGKRADHYYGSDIFISNAGPASGKTWSITGGMATWYKLDSSLAWGATSNSTNNAKGIFPGSDISNVGKMSIKVAYNSISTLTIDGTFHVEVYALDWPGKVSPFV